MTTFRCKKCKQEISSTKYVKIISVFCKNCRMAMVKLYKPTELMFQKEKELNLLFQKQNI